MKKIIVSVVIILIMMLSNLNTNAQISFVGNGTGGAITDFCGWDNTMLFPLRIEHQGTSNINFLLGSLPSGQLDQSGNANTSFGYFTFPFLTSGTNNSVFGDQSGSSLTLGGGNSFFGSSSGYSTSTGINNTFMGYQSGSANTIGESNVFTGY